MRSSRSSAAGIAAGSTSTMPATSPPIARSRLRALPERYRSDPDHRLRDPARSTRSLTRAQAPPFQPVRVRSSRLVFRPRPDHQAPVRASSRQSYQPVVASARLAPALPASGPAAIRRSQSRGGSVTERAGGNCRRRLNSGSIVGLARHEYQCRFRPQPIIAAKAVESIGMAEAHLKLGRSRLFSDGDGAEVIGTGEPSPCLENADIDGERPLFVCRDRQPDADHRDPGHRAKPAGQPNAQTPEEVRPVSPNEAGATATHCRLTRRRHRLTEG